MSFSPRALMMSIAPFIFIGANYYIITRRITIFGGNITQRLPILLISLGITLIFLIMQTASFPNTKFLSIIGSVGSRCFILIPLLAILTGFFHLIETPLLKGGMGGSSIRRIAVSTVLLFIAYGLRATLSTKITKVELTTSKIPHDVKIMLVADIHVDDVFSTLRLKEIKKQIELQQPDLVLIAGDFFNRPSVRHTQYFSILSELNVPMYAVEGNHDTRGDKWLAFRRIQDLTNIQFLFNENVILPELNLQIIGTKERGHGQASNTTIEEDLIASNIQPWDTFNILLTHQPIGLRKLENLPIDLELAGHTHKLQIRGLHFLSYLINDYTYGLYLYPSTDDNDLSIIEGMPEGQKNYQKSAFITQGIWTRGLPLRIWTRSEIVMIHLSTQ